MTALQQLHDQRASTWSDIWEHLPWIRGWCIDNQAQTVVELGVRSGNSTAALLAAVEVTGGHLWSVDIEAPDVPAEFTESGLWTLIVGDDLHLADRLPDQIDVLFIDTSHHYQHTLDELRLYGPRSTAILLHDTELEHPHAAPRNDPPFPVRAAIEAWCVESGRSWFNRSGCYGLGVILG